MTIYTVLNMLPALAAAHSNCILQLQSLCKVKVLFRQPKKPAAWDKPRGRSPTRTSPQTVPGAQPTGQGWLRLLRAPWEHPHTPLGGESLPTDRAAHISRSFCVWLQAPRLYHAGYQMLGQTRWCLLGACKSSTWSNSYMRCAWSEATSF